MTLSSTFLWCCFPQEPYVYVTISSQIFSSLLFPETTNKFSFEFSVSLLTKMDKQATHNRSEPSHTSQNDSKWFVITHGQEAIMNGYQPAFSFCLYYPEGRAHQKNTFSLFSHLLEIEAWRHNQGRTTGAPLSQVGYLHFEVSVDSRWWLFQGV